MNSSKWIFYWFLTVYCLTLQGCANVPYCKDGCPDPKNIKLQDQGVEQRLIVLGDTGDPSINGEPVLRILKQYAKKLPQKTTILFMGDNIYERGLPDISSSDRQEAERRLQAQIDTLKTMAHGVFIPGNHDWDKGGNNGLKHLRNQSDYISEAAKLCSLNLSFLPEAGCPGPKVFDLGTTASVIILDTEWWLQKKENPNVNTASNCEASTEKQVLDALSQKLKIENNSGRWTMVASHHPIETYGPHGGFFDWKDHLFPLDALDNRLKIPFPILGSVLALVRTWYSPSAQDLSNNTYSEMRSKILEVLESGKPLLYLGAHDHGLQVFKGAPGAEYHVVSGGGSENKITSVGHNEFTQFAHAHTGFMMIDFLTNKCVNLSVIEPDEQINSGQVVFSKILACKSGMHKPN